MRPAKGDGATATQSFRFSRQARLTRPAEFQHVFSGARRSADRYFTVLYRDSEHDAARIGFAIAKKRVARAVGRNRIRRIARESFRVNRHLLGSLDIVVLSQPAAAKASNAELFASLDAHWRRLAERTKKNTQ